LGAVIAAGCVRTCLCVASLSVVAVLWCGTCLLVAETINTDYLCAVLAGAGSVFRDTDACGIAHQSAALRIFGIFINAWCILTLFLAGTLAISINGTIFEEFAVVLNQAGLGDALISTA